jgi:hypothetical protein
MYYLSGRANNRTQSFKVSGKSVEQTAQLGRDMGLDPETIIVCLCVEIVYNHPWRFISNSLSIAC